VYLAFILDVYARMLVAWQLGTHMRSSLVVDALEMAVGPSPTSPRRSRRPYRPRTPCTSLRESDRLDEHGNAPSVGSRGDAYDNAMAEAWVATHKTGLVQGRLLSFEHLEHETLRWISFCNHDRLHEELGDIPPAEHEQLMKGSNQRPRAPPETSRASA
jgi:putative transposase